MANVAAHFKLRAPVVNNLSISIVSVKFQALRFVARNTIGFGFVDFCLAHIDVFS
jgi:hypothetical protein